MEEFMRIGIDIDGVLTNIEQFFFDYISKSALKIILNIKFVIIIIIVVKHLISVKNWK